MLDYRQHWEELLFSDNPFAIVILAHLKTLETTRDATSRKQWKLTLIKLLYQRGYAREDVIRLFRFIDWLLVLPTDLEMSVWKDIIAYQEELSMPYITSIEKIAKAEGKAEGFRLSIKRMLKAKFGDEALDLAARIEVLFFSMSSECADLASRRASLQLD